MTPNQPDAPAPRPTGLLLAAGRGRRAGGSKQLLPWLTPAGLQPLIAVSYDAIARVCASMIVVLGHEPEAIRFALSNRSFTAVQSDPDAPMADSVRAGLDAALASAPDAPVLLHPADNPGVDRLTILRLISASGLKPGRAILPEHQGRGGHPVLIPPTIARLLLDQPLPEGLGAFWRANPALVCRVPVNDPAIRADIDLAPRPRSI
ncbi:MAG: NTP transferase domain-containing protein [Phycisphaerales bacterium]|nr:NTP transferase domain-containing protein [Phycisphaerales bacterium]